ncbi:1264_t:CDS:1, partial [Funneliformis caledonium]
VSWLNPLKPSENLLKKRKITKDEEELEKETTSSLSSNMIKQKWRLKLLLLYIQQNHHPFSFLNNNQKLKLNLLQHNQLVLIMFSHRLSNL